MSFATRAPARLSSAAARRAMSPGCKCSSMCSGSASAAARRSRNARRSAGIGVEPGKGEISLSAVRSLNARLLVFKVWVVTGRSGRGRWQRVMDAREQARSALGSGSGLLDAPSPKPKLEVQEIHAHPSQPFELDQPEYVLSIGETAMRLGLSGVEVAAMIEAGRIKVLPTGFTWMVPMAEVERLSARSR